ncbi:MAG: PAS domain-containing protein [Francisellaceae bacterium]|jgi:two-component system, sensor histidine kinase FlrB|nr:PAS domain-containing protein [Francisellaceae bacterium]MBT6208022.1 PAS domain-containing protein [Francisellaceae bacterium]MBT6539685.1 PAS domain-containing protein [Francisellaceae bacterium]
MGQTLDKFGTVSNNVLEYYENFEARLSVVNEKLLTINSQYMASLEEKASLCEKLSLILNNLPAGIVILDNYGKVIKANTQAVDIFSKELKNNSWVSILDDFYEHAIDGNEVLLSNGKIITVTTMPLQKSNEQIIMLQDVTKRSMERNIKSKQKSVQALEKLASSVAHQIKTPLSTALLCISQINGEQNAKEINRSVAIVKKKIEDVVILTNELLGMERERNSVKKDVLVEEIHDDLQIYVKTLEIKYGKVVTIKFNAHNLYIKTNKLSLISAILNIIENALDVNPNGKPVIVSFKHVNNNLSIEVQDQGPGIKKHIATDNIFAPFVSTKNHGNGLGLSVAKAIVDSHQGKIEYINNSDNGLTFIITIEVIR